MLHALHRIIHQCTLCHSEEDVESIFKELSYLIPFDRWAIASLFYSKTGRISFENQVWFRQVPEYERFYFENKLYEVDPIYQPLFEQFAPGKRGRVIHWSDHYEKSVAGRDFLDRIVQFGFSYGYSAVHRVNQVSGLYVSIAGPELSKQDPDVMHTLELFAPHLLSILFQAKIGKLGTLTDRQFLTFQLLRTCMKAETIAGLLNVGESNIDKACRAIRKKTGHKSRATMIIPE